MTTVLVSIGLLGYEEIVGLNMFQFLCYDQKVDNTHHRVVATYMQSSHTFLWDIVKHILRIQTTGAI